MKKSELIDLIRETVEEARVAGQVTTRPGERKKYIKGQGWVWVKKDDVMPGSSNVAAVESESEGLDSIKRELDGIVVALQADNGEEYEYSYKGTVNYYSPVSKQWNTLPLNDSMRKNPITIVSQLLQKTNTKEIEKPTGARENFVRAAELFDEFKGKFSNIFAYPNTMDVNEQGKPTLLRFTNNLLNAKKDLIAFDKFNKIEGDDTMSGLKVDDEAPIDVDKELSPSYSRKGVQDYDAEDGGYSSEGWNEFDRLDESKKNKLISGLRSVIKEVMEEESESPSNYSDEKFDEFEKLISGVKKINYNDESYLIFKSLQDFQKIVGPITKKTQVRLLKEGLKLPFIASESFTTSCFMGDTDEFELVVSEDGKELTTKHKYYDA